MYSQTWYELLDQLVYREGLSRPQIARRSGVRTKTIASWLRGDVKRPRRWQPIARVLNALNASTEEADAILLAAGYRSAAEMTSSARDEEERALLSDWLAPSSPFMAPDLPVARLIGRDHEYRNALRSIEESRRLAIWGMGGVGKTTLAVALAHEVGGQYDDGVYWGDLRTSSPEAILESWCHACNVDLSRMTDFNSRATHMRGVFSQQKALIVLDDVVDSRQALQMIPSQLSDCAVIVTTRSAEVAQNMTHRDDQQIIALTPMLRRESRDLFAEVLGEDILLAQIEAADEVARLLGDLPLALQIAAAMSADTGLTLQNLAVLLANMQSRLDRLRQDQKPIVRLAFEQSWELIGENMRAALTALAVFEGRVFTTAAFAAAAGIDEVQGMFMLARLARLSLLTAVQDDQYQQHTLLAAYSLEKLEQKQEPWLRFANYYLGLLENSKYAKETFMDEVDNIMAAMRTAHRLEEWSLVLKFSEILQPLWRRQGLYTLTREGSQWALDAANKVGDKRTEAEIDYYWGVASLEQSSYEEADERLGRALSLLKPFEENVRIGDANYHLARNALARDDYEGAHTAVQQAWQSYQQAEDVRGMGRALYRMAHIFFNQGAYERTIELVNDAAKTQSQGDDIRGWFQSVMLGVTASLYLKRMDEAEAYRKTAAALVEQMDDRVETSVYYYTYADLSRFQGEFERALKYGSKALAIFRETQDFYSQANTLNLLGGIEASWNEAEPGRRLTDEGLDYCRQGLEICERIDYTIGRGMLLLLMGRLLAQRGDTQEACATWHHSMEIADALGHEWMQQRLQQLINESQCSPH